MRLESGKALEKAASELGFGDYKESMGLDLAIYTLSLRQSFFCVFFSSGSDSEQKGGHL